MTTDSTLHSAEAAVAEAASRFDKIIAARDSEIVSLRRRLAIAEQNSACLLGVPPIVRSPGGNHGTSGDVLAEYTAMPAGAAKSAFFQKHADAIWKLKEAAENAGQ